MVRRKVKFAKENKLLVVSRQILLVLISTFIGILTANWLASFLPQYYESTSLLTINPPIISGGSSLGLYSEEDKSQRLNTINYEVLSKSSLEPIINKYNLGTNKNFPIEMQIEEMRRKIKVQPENAENKKVFAFRVSYRDENPETARDVVQELASKYINIQTLSEIDISEKTQEFMDKQLEDMKLELDEIEQKRLQIMTNVIDKQLTSDSESGLVSQFSGLKNKKKYRKKEQQFLINQKAQLNQKISELNGMIGLISKIGSQKELSEFYSEKKELENKLVKIEKQLERKNLEITKIENEIDEIEIKISKFPNMKTSLADINAQYKAIKLHYDELLKKQNEVVLSTQWNGSNGNQIKVVDPASLPTLTVLYWRINGIGAGIGFLFGLMLVLRASFGKRNIKVDLR